MRGEGGGGTVTFFSVTDHVSCAQAGDQRPQAAAEKDGRGQEEAGAQDHRQEGTASGGQGEDHRPRQVRARLALLFGTGFDSRSLLFCGVTLFVDCSGFSPG